MSLLVVEVASAKFGLLAVDKNQSQKDHHFVVVLTQHFQLVFVVALAFSPYKMLRNCSFLSQLRFILYFKFLFLQNQSLFQ